MLYKPLLKPNFLESRKTELKSIDDLLGLDIYRDIFSNYAN